MMKPLRRPRDVDPDIAVSHALRRYIVARAAGRVAAEYARADDIGSIGVWYGCDVPKGERIDGKKYKRIRIPGAPWCRYLGRDVSIASDPDLQALFEVLEGGPDGWTWTILKGEVTRNRMKALRSWRSRGREIRARIRAVRRDIHLPTPPELAIKYGEKGIGLR